MTTGTKRPSMQDVALAAGVSQATVSLVLNDVADSGISESTKRRVRETATRLGYRHNAMARGLKLQRSDTIGFISDNITITPFAAGLIEGAQVGAREAGKHLLIVNVDYEENRDNSDAIEHAIDELIERRVDGVIYATMFHRIVDIPRSLHELPSVLLDAQATDGSLPSVVPDDLGGAMEMTMYLLGLGHRSIVHMSRALGPSAVDLRRNGFFAAHEQFGVAPLTDAVIECEVTTPAAFEAGMKLLTRSDRPTAIFCFNDRMAWGVYQAAAELGVSIPGDVSVVGFDDVPLVAPVLRPPMTTMRLPHVEMGRWAIDRLISGNTQLEHEVLPCPLIVRESVAPPPEPERAKVAT
ncbi:MAG: LacI family DNA-binding transcriptional regulator [Actinomycetia bacterium]|nr:LacI family DNA-binding transcriptional regulator [Actinomycetes bacterium]